MAKVSVEMGGYTLSYDDSYLVIWNGERLCYLPNDYGTEIVDDSLWIDAWIANFC